MEVDVCLGGGLCALSALQFGIIKLSGCPFDAKRFIRGLSKVVARPCTGETEKSFRLEKDLTRYRVTNLKLETREKRQTRIKLDR